jgi:hypothetical protein
MQLLLELRIRHSYCPFNYCSLKWTIIHLVTLVVSIKINQSLSNLRRFNFGSQSGKPIPENEQTLVRSKTIGGGRCDAVFMWWDIFMDPDKKVRLSCAPKWAHQGVGVRVDLHWRTLTKKREKS